jgi:predicted small lipoprotein YifL
MVNADSWKSAMRKPVCSVITLTLLLAILSACGQKGPLFLPGDASSLQSIPSAEELRQLSEEENDDDEKEEIEKDPSINPM